MRPTASPSPGRSTILGLGFLGTCVAGLYAAVGAALLAPHVPGDAARGFVSTGLSSPVPALRYDMPHAEDGGTARGLRPTVMSKLLFGAPPAPAGPPPGRHVPGLSVAEARALWDDHGYRLQRVTTGGAGVPRLYLEAVPNDLRALRDAQVRKNVFLRTVLPLVLRVNEEIAADRARLRDLAGRLAEGGAASAEEAAWLADLAAYYKLETPDVPLLLKRVDVVPPSLALAQAAAESGWGTSRFAREGNALFGQWTTNPDVRGLVPLDRAGEATHRVRAFDTLLEAVRAYARNLNTHRAYAGFRCERHKQRTKGLSPDGYRLAGTLLAYSERGPDYVETLRLIMRVNDLTALDDARLGAQVARSS